MDFNNQKFVDGNICSQGGRKVDFKENGFMYAVALVVIAFVVAQSAFFIAKAWKRARELGISKETLKQTVVSSALFTIAPAISILTTVIVLASALGIVLPWIRLSVVGNLTYESVAASTVLEKMGANLSTPITDPEQFGAVAWIMTLGIILSIILPPIMCKTIQKKVGGAISKSEKNSKLGDVLSAAAFIGIIAAFIARAIYGKTSDGVGDAGIMSVCVLVTSIILSLVLESLCAKFKWDKFQPFAMPLSMFGAMGMAVLLNYVLPEAVSTLTWWG